jgi:hypothetical protein
MKLVTYDDGRVGKLVDGRVLELDVPDMRGYFELGGEVQPTGREVALADVRLRAPIVPKKFFRRCSWPATTPTTSRVPT